MECAKLSKYKQRRGACGWGLRLPGKLPPRQRRFPLCKTVALWGLCTLSVLLCLDWGCANPFLGEVFPCEREHRRYHLFPREREPKRVLFVLSSTAPYYKGRVKVLMTLIRHIFQPLLGTPSQDFKYKSKIQKLNLSFQWLSWVHSKISLRDTIKELMRNNTPCPRMSTEALSSIQTLNKVKAKWVPTRESW